MRERTASTPDERSQREELERLQAALKVTRAALTTASAEADRTAAALVTTIGEAKAAIDATRARLKEAQDEAGALKAELRELDARLEAKRKEDAVLERGARLRDVYVDWNPDDRREAVGDGLTEGQAKLFAAVIISLVLGTMFIGSCK